MVLAVIAIFLLIRDRGEVLTAPPPLAGSAIDLTKGASDVFWHLLLALASVVAVGRLLARLFDRFGQPPVIGEVVGGILLGPSFLGFISPEASAYVLPSEVAPYLGAIAQLGVVIYMFLVGVELNPERLRGRVHTTVAISHASIVLPF